MNGQEHGRAGLGRAALWALAALFCLMSTFGAAAMVVVLPADAERVDLTPSLSYLEDRDHRLSIAEVVARDQAGAFGRRDGNHFGFTKSAFWSKVTIRNAGPAAQEWLLLLARASDQVEAFVREGDGPAVALTGRLPFRVPLYRVVLQPGVDTTLYVRRVSMTFMWFPTELYSPWALHERDAREGVVFGSVAALSFAVGIYVLFIWRVMRERSQLMFIAMQIAFIGIVMWLSGKFGDWMPWLPSFWVGFAGHLSLCAAIAAAIWNGLWFLRLDRAWPRLSRVVGAIALASFLDLGLEALGEPVGRMITYGLLAAVPVAVVTMAVLALPHNRRAAGLYLLCWSPWLAATVGYGAVLTGLVRVNSIYWLFYIGDAGWTLLSGLTIAYQFRAAQAEKERALIRNLAALRESRSKIAEYRDHLEELVDVRTQALSSALSNERQMVEQQRTFLSMIDHEFRNPLAAIDGHAFRLADGRMTPDRRDLDRRGNAIRGAVRELIALMESVRHQTRIDDALAGIKAEPVDPAALVEEAAAAALRDAPAGRVQIDCKGLPPQIAGDRALLATALVNLIANAVKYSDPGGEVLVRAWASDRHVTLSVADRGIGIPRADLPRIFDRFYRAGNVGGRHGSGLGLHLCRRVAELHGGTLTVDSVEGQGSLFTLTLPIAAAGP